MTTLIIARHGNTFGAGDTPTRVGGRTDLPLVEKGHAQGTALGAHLKERGLIPDVVYASTLQRTQQTAQAAITALGIHNPIYQLEIFNEVDYGPDENKTEAEVIARIGADAITAWDKEARVPEGWKIDPQEVIQNWINFGQQIHEHEDEHNHEETIMVVTSNGIARFAPYMTGDFEDFAARFPLKLSTGAYGVMRFENGAWRVLEWNTKP